MSIFRDHAFGYNRTERDERLQELRRRASANVTQLYANRDKLKPDKPKKLTELEQATAYEIELGNMILEERDLRKVELRYARKKTLTDDDRAHWEEVDARLDTLREELNHLDRDERRRCVRLWNKSRKIRYKV